MKLARNFLLGLILTFTLFHCLDVFGIAAPGIKKVEASSLSDTIQKLDTLVSETRIVNSNLSHKYARIAYSLATRAGSPEAIVQAYIMFGISYSKTYKDSSYFYFMKAMKLAENSGRLDQKVKIIYNLAILYKEAYNYKQSVIFLDSTIRLAEIAKEYEYMTMAYNLLGNMRIDIHDNVDAQLMYETSFKIAREHQLYKQMGVAMGNLAKFQNDTRRSIKMQYEAINYLKKAKRTEEEIASILINIGNRHTRPDSALFYYKSALKFAESGNLPEIEYGAYNNMAYIYLDLGNIPEAESCLVDHAIPLAIREKDNSWLSTLYDSYADILSAKGAYQDALKWQKKALKTRILSDTLQASDQVRLLATLLDVKNKELTIQNKEKELLIQQNRLQTTRFWLIFSVLVIIGSVFISLWLQQRSHMKFQVQQITSAKKLIEMEESEKGRTARELHDITGQLIMGITGAIENLDIPDEKIKSEIRGKIKDLGKSIRLISHRMNKAMLEHFTFNELITGQCEDIQKLTGIPVYLEMTEDYTDLQEEMVLHTYRIVQELLTNASKYVKDGHVNISLITQNGNLILSYTDNGPGFETTELKNSGMGIMNIFERAKVLGGLAKLSSSPGNGTKWIISIPKNRKKSSSSKSFNV